MEVVSVIERVERVAATRVRSDAGRGELEARLRDLADLGSWRDAAEAEIVAALAKVSSFPEAAVADAGRCSVGTAATTTERAATLESAPAFADALDDARVTAGHVDVLTRGANALEPEQRAELFGRAETLADVAASSTVEQFHKRVRREVRDICGDTADKRLERQRRQVGLSTWTDGDGMWRLKCRFDPVTALAFHGRLESAVEALFATKVPPWCPSDPVEKQRHLKAIALARLAGVDVADLVGVSGEQGGVPLSPIATGRSEMLAVIHIDATTGSSANSSCRSCNATLTGDDVSGSSGASPVDVEWSIPVEVPDSVLAQLAGHADIVGIVVRNGVVLHGPGELDLGRTTRLANRAQRRALRAMYSTCAIPGCAVHYDRCKIHHVIWWRHGGRTDLDNLLPLCSHHHTKVHRANWELTLGSKRELSIRFPDGTIHNTGPPRSNAA